MKVLIQPGDGVAAIVKAIVAARHSVEIVIFRFDQREVERALANAVQRGVAVHALIANTNRAGEANLRRLEMRLLGYGVTVARTADDLLRYHGKLMIIDRRELHLLAFNMTYLDIERSRSFGAVTRTRALVREAIRLFEADVKRQPFETRSSTFLVSPVNARKQLAAFLKGARKQILIYDPEVSDPEMAGILEQRMKAGVEVRIVGKTARKAAHLNAHKLGIRLHTRTIIRDGNAVFLGSQSLRALELTRGARWNYFSRSNRGPRHSEGLRGRLAEPGTERAGDRTAGHLEAGQDRKAGGEGGGARTSASRRSGR